MESTGVSTRVERTAYIAPTVKEALSRGNHKREIFREVPINILLLNWFTTAIRASKVFTYSAVRSWNERRKLI